MGWFFPRSETRPAVEDRSSARPQRSDELAQAGVERAGLRQDGLAPEAAAHIFGIRRDGNVTVVRTLPQRLRDDGVEIAAQPTPQGVRRRRAPGGVLLEYLKRLAAIGNTAAPTSRPCSNRQPPTTCVAARRPTPRYSA